MQAKHNLSQHDVNEFPEKNKGGTCKEWKRILQGWVVCQCHSWSPSGPKGKHSTYVCTMLHTTKEEQSRGTVGWLLNLNCLLSYLAPCTQPNWPNVWIFGGQSTILSLCSSLHTTKLWSTVKSQAVDRFTIQFLNISWVLLTKTCY